MPNKTYNLYELANYINAKFFPLNSSNIQIKNLSSIENANQFSLCALFNRKYLPLLNKTNPAACIIHPKYIEFAPKHLTLLIHNHPYKAYAQLSQLYINSNKTSTYKAPTAFISSTAKIGQNCQIEHGVYIAKDTIIGDNCKIGVNTYIGDNVIIGNNCIIENQVSISNTRIANYVVIHPGARIGQEGFGFASDSEGHYSIAHQGLVIIGNYVHIGANTCIDRGSLENTEIADHVRLDNLIQIGHNVKIGKGTIMAAQVGIAGSTKIGDFVTFGGQAGAIGHINIADESTILVRALVTKSIKTKSRMGGYPAIIDKDWHRQTTYLKRMTQKNKKEE